ncbi:hypothetical protein C0993_000447, partial [Termitomyces sp. T159_Od127]
MTGMQVPTPQGPVIGTMANPRVRQFLGIPYATAKRWEAPMLPPIRSSPLSADTFGDSCVQELNPTLVDFLSLAGFDNATIFVPESENCLTVNIWTPSPDRKQDAAVLLWVYGGSFIAGTNIVRDNDDIVVVSFNYRLNIFGFPNAPQLISNTTQPQNFGLLDLDAAVQWVHDNIAAFGGDPERIVLFGQSAGAVAIDAYTFAHPQDTIVKGGDLFIVSSLETAMLTASFVKGVIEESGNLVRAMAGNFLRVPLLGGTTANEGDVFVLAQELVDNGVVFPDPTEIVSDPDLTEIVSDLLTQ